MRPEVYENVLSVGCHRGTFFSTPPSLDFSEMSFHSHIGNLPTQVRKKLLVHGGKLPAIDSHFPY